MLAGIVLTLISLWVGQNHGLLPVAASEEAVLVDGLFNTMMTIGTGLFLLVIGVLLVSVFRFRQRPGDETDGDPVHGNIPLEILWTSIPAVIVLVLAVYSFEVYNTMGGLNPMDHSVAHGHPTQRMAKLPGAAIAATLTDAPATAEENPNQEMQDNVKQDPATDAVRNNLPQKRNSPVVASPRVGASPENQGRPPQLVVSATGLQYAWIFTYPDSGVTSGELHLPVGREVLLNISANDVLHAFWVPEYRLKQDAIPGRQSELRFTPAKIGEYPVICAELCGAYHGAMKTKVIAESPADFDAWIASQQVASADGLEQAIAINPAAQAPDEFLAPYVSNLKLDAHTLNQLHPTAPDLVAHGAIDHAAD
jgi:cytochrome c oxidase subunit 2